MPARYLLVLASLSCGLLVAQEPPAPKTTSPQPTASSVTPTKKPMWQRMLQGEDAKKAGEMEKKINELEAADKFDEAIKLAEELLAFRKSKQGEDHWEVVDGRWRIVTIQKFRSADPALRKCYWHDVDDVIVVLNQAASSDRPPDPAILVKWMFLLRQMFGDNHPLVATNHNDIAYILARNNKHSEATPYIREALMIRCSSLGREHPDTAFSHTSLAFNLGSKTKYAEAEPHYREALAIRHKVLGAEHTDTATSTSNLACNLGAQAKYAEAEPLYREALALRLKVLSPEHPNIANSLGNLATHLDAIGKYSEAEPLHRNALAIHVKASGVDSRHTATSYSNYAYCLNQQGKHAEAEVLNREAMSIRQRTLGSQHPDTADSLNNLAGNLHKLGRGSEAEPLLRKALAIRTQANGEESAHTATCYSNLAYCLSQQGRRAEAEMLHRTALKVRQSTLGSQHPDTASSLNNLAVTLLALGQHAEAEALFQSALYIRIATLGDKHRDTAASHMTVALVLWTKGEHTTAETHLTRAIAGHEAGRLSGAAGIDRAILPQSNPRPLLAALHARQGAAAAWPTLELGLARGLLDHQAGIQSRYLTDAERQEQSRLHEKLAGLEPRVVYLITQRQRSPEEEKELQTLFAERKQAEERLSALAVAESQRAVASSQEIQAAIPADGAIVLWVDVSAPGVEEHWGCVVRHQGEPHWERLPGTGDDRKWTTEDTELPGHLRSQLHFDFSEVELSKELSNDTLYQQRLAPLEKHLVGVKQLFVVPVHEMAGIPVEMLTDRYTISYIPSGTYLARLKARAKPQGERLLALGDPAYPQPEVKPDSQRPPRGVFITRVMPDSAAQAAGLKREDVLLKYGDTSLVDHKELSPAIAAAKNVQTVKLKIWRAGQELELTARAGELGVTLAEKSGPAAWDEKVKTDAMLADLMRGGRWERLPGTRVELERLKQMWGRERVLALADREATEGTLDHLRVKDELRQFRYLHLATHGEANNVRAFESRLVLAQNRTKELPLPPADGPFLDGFLSAREVLEYWKLDAELVTLSACETALGRQGGGDGLLGFAQAFLVAGSRSVCLTLWKVPDYSTALLMDRFYSNLLGKRPGLSKPMGKAASLHEAKQWLRGLTHEEAAAVKARLPRGETLKLPNPSNAEGKPFAHPRYWAAFILIGDPN